MAVLRNLPNRRRPRKGGPVLKPCMCEAGLPDG